MKHSQYKRSQTGGSFYQFQPNKCLTHLIHKCMKVHSNILKESSISTSNATPELSAEGDKNWWTWKYNSEIRHKRNVPSIVITEGLVLIYIESSVISVAWFANRQKNAKRRLNRKNYIIGSLALFIIIRRKIKKLLQNIFPGAKSTRQIFDKLIDSSRIRKLMAVTSILGAELTCWEKMTKNLSRQQAHIWFFSTPIEDLTREKNCGNHLRRASPYLKMQRMKTLPGNKVPGKSWKSRNY